MITLYSCWEEQGRVTAHLTCGFGLKEGVPDIDRNPYPSLSVYFDAPKTLVDTRLFAEEFINVEIPVFERRQALKADRWLRTYAIKLNERLGDAPAPVPQQAKEG
jgi:hypothetical protein